MSKSEEKAEKDVKEAEEPTVAPSASGTVEESTGTSAPKPPSKRWYVLRVQSNKEDSVREKLEKKVKAEGMEELIPRVLVPTEKVTEIKGGKKRVTQRKLYPGYVMVEMILTEESQHFVRGVSGVGDFVGPTAKTPVPLTSQEVDKILGDAKKTAEDSQPKVHISFSPGDSVKIKEGPFQNFDGIVEEVIPDKGLVKVVVTIFGRPTPVELEYWQMESV